jgi:Protein of unknown function (DUF2892)
MINKGVSLTDFKKLILEENVGGLDLLFRTAFGVLAIIALSTGFVKTSPWKWVVSLIAFTGLYTSIMRHCSPYYIFKINTAKNKQK